MKFKRDQVVETPRGLGIVDVPMEETCHVRLSPSINPTAKLPCEFVIFKNSELREVNDKSYS